jgi:hypothetical protein
MLGSTYYDLSFSSSFCSRNGCSGISANTPGHHIVERGGIGSVWQPILSDRGKNHPKQASCYNNGNYDNLSRSFLIVFQSPPLFIARRDTLQKKSYHSEGFHSFHP